MQHLVELRDRLFDNERLKVELLASPNSELVKEVLDLSSFQSSETLCLKLEVLFLIILISGNSKVRFSDAYVTFVTLIYADNVIAKNLETLDITVCHKYLKLLNLCQQNCLVVKYPHVDVFAQCFSEFVSHSLSGGNEMNNVILEKVFIDGLKFLLHEEAECKNKQVNVDLIESLERILVLIVNKYIHLINFKFRSVNKRTKRGKLRQNKYMKIERLLNVPQSIKLIDELDSRLLALSLALYSKICFKSIKTKKSNIPKKLLLFNSHFKLFVTSLLKCADTDLKCSSLKILLVQYFVPQSDINNRTHLSQLLPLLIDSLNSSVLPSWFSPFQILCDLVLQYNISEPLGNPVIFFLTETNLIYGLLSFYAKLLSSTTQTNASLETISEMNNLFAAICASDDSQRHLLLNNKNLFSHMENGLKGHLTLLKIFVVNKQAIKRKVDSGSSKLPTKGVPVLSNGKITRSWLNLLRSFSRNITTVRALKKNYVVEILMDTLKIIYQISQDCYFAGQNFLKMELSIMGMILRIISNFVVEFSVLQNSIVKHGIIEIIGNILSDSVFNAKKIPIDDNRQKTFENLQVSEITECSLWVLKHLMYNAKNSEKLELISQISMRTILEFVNDKNWSVQFQCFQLIKNLTCNSRRVVNILLRTSNSDTNDESSFLNNKTSGAISLFKFFAHKMNHLQISNELQKRTLESILYIIVNIAAVNETKKELVMSQDDILHLIKNILDRSSSRKGKQNLDQLKLASLWVLNNLLWNSSISHYTYLALEDYQQHRSIEPGDRAENLEEDEDDDEDDGEENNALQRNLNQIKKNEIISNQHKLYTNGEESSGMNGNSEFVHTGGSTDTGTTSINNLVIERCKKLERLGITDAVKKNIYSESILVKEKAKTLLYHMELLLDEA